MQKRTLTFHHYAFIAVFLWASAYVSTKVALESFSVGVVGFLRCLVASLVLGCVVVGGRLRGPGLSGLSRAVFSGITGMGLYLLLLNQGATTLGATTTGIVIATTPIFTALLAFVIYGERLNIFGWLAILLAFSGIVVMTLWEGTLELNVGIVWNTAAALSLATYNILQRKRPVGVGALSMTAYSFFAATIMLAYFLPDALAEVRQAPPGHIAIMVYLGVFPSALAYLAWVKAMAMTTRTSAVANYMFLTPLLALLLDFLIVLRFPDAGTLIGGAIIMVSLLLFGLVGRK